MGMRAGFAYFFDSFPEADAGFSGAALTCLGEPFSADFTTGFLGFFPGVEASPRPYFGVGFRTDLVRAFECTCLSSVSL